MDARCRQKHLSDYGICLALLLLASSSVIWCAPLSAQETPQPQHRAEAAVTYESRQDLGKGLTQAMLSSGLTVLVRENHAAPVATVRCFAKNTGSAFEGRYLGTGISHMLEHLVALGSTTKRPESEIQQLLDSMGGRTNAFTSTDLTAYYIDCPAAKVDLAIELVAESMQYSTIPEDEYLREMGVVQRELEMGQADRTRMLYQALKSLVYFEHPVRHPTIGYLPVVQSVQREDVIAFYKNRYVPQNLIFIVVGDVDTDHVLEEVERHFKSFQRTTERGVTLAEEPEQASPRSKHMEMPGETTHFAIGWPTVMLQSPDLYPLDVASYLLTNGDSSRLGYRLKIEQPLAVSVNSSSYTPGFVNGWFDITVQCEPGKLDTCRQLIDEEIARLQNELVSEDELAKVKRQKAAEHVFGQQTVQEQANSLGYSYLNTGDALFDDHYVEGIQGVTAEQIRDVARRYFIAERTNTVIIDPPGSSREATREVQQIAESPVEKHVLPNGLTVLLKRHAVTPIVSMQAFVRGGIISDSDRTSGRAALACELMLRGTQKYSGREIAEYFDSVGGSIAVDSQRNTSYLQCSVLTEDFDTAFDYCYQVLVEPTLPEDEFQKVQQQQLGRIAARKANPQTEILDFWSTLIPNRSPYSRTVLGRLDSVKQLTAADCQEFHRDYFVPNNMVLSVFGDIDPQTTLARIEETFGRLPKAPDFQFPEFSSEHEQVEAARESLETQHAETAMLVMSYPTVSIQQVETRAALSVLNALLTGGSGAGGRLFYELRGERLVYYVFGIEIAGPPPGYFLFMAQTRPETLPEVIQRIEASIRRIAKEGIEAEEFELAKQKLIAAHSQSNTTPASQAFQATLDELYGLGYDHDRGYDERISAVTVDDVQRVIRNYFQTPTIATSAPE